MAGSGQARNSDSSALAREYETGSKQRITAVPQTPSPSGAPAGMQAVERSRSQSREGWGEGI